MTRAASSTLQIDPEVFACAGAIWRRYQLMLTGQEPASGLWFGRFIAWFQGQPNERDPWVEAAWLAAVDVNAIKSGK